MPQGLKALRLGLVYVRAKARTYQPVPTALVNPGPAALDQNHQNDNKEYAGNYPDNRCIVHVVLPSLNERDTCETNPE
jgi:hypothetical protein